VIKKLTNNIFGNNPNDEGKFKRALGYGSGITKVQFPSTDVRIKKVKGIYG